MKKTGIADLKNNLSRYIDQVKSGESILVLDRNQPVAQIIPLQPAQRGAPSNREKIASLERKGLIRRGSGDPKKSLAKRRLTRVSGSVLKDLLDERRSSW